MVDLFTLAATIQLNTEKFVQGINTATNTGKNFADKLQMRANTVSVAVGNLISSTVQAAGRGMLNLTKDALKIAGDVEQALGGSQAVFGAWAEDIQTKARSAFESAGLSAGAYLETANKMGSLFKGAGFTTTEAFDMTSAAMQRAADVASIMGVDINSAMESVAGMAKGNFTMMDNLGVAINDTTLKAYAMEKGMKGNVEQMTTAQKVGLAYQMFLERTAQYAGNYAKENETLNGSIQTMKASWDNLLSGQGTVDDFMAATERAARVTWDSLGEILPRLGGALVKAAPVALAKVGTALSSWWDTDASTVATNGANLFVQSVNAVFGTNIPQLETINLPKSDTIKETVSAWWTGERSMIEDLCDWTLSAVGLPKIGDMANGVKSWWAMTKKNFEDSLEWTVQMFGFPDTETAKAAIKEWWDPIAEWFSDPSVWAKPSGETNFQNKATEFFDYSNPDSMHDLNQYNPYGMGTFNYQAWVDGQLSEESGKEMQKDLNGLGLTVPVDVVMNMKDSINNFFGGGGVVTRQRYATGLGYVPYNDFPAYLHEGEAVLTKTQAAAWREGSAGGADFRRLESLLSELNANVKAMQGMKIMMDGREVGNAVTETVSNNIARGVNRTRFAPATR